MKKIISLTTLTVAFSFATVASSAVLAQTPGSCRMTIQAEREMILEEGSKALNNQPTNPCFERLVQSEMAVVSSAGGNADRAAIIQQLQAAAIKGIMFENGEQ